MITPIPYSTACVCIVPYVRVYTLRLFYFGGEYFSSTGSGPHDGETCLPQDPKADAAGRKKQLAAKQKDYTWRMGVRERRKEGERCSEKSRLPRYHGYSSSNMMLGSNDFA